MYSIRHHYMNTFYIPQYIHHHYNGNKLKNKAVTLYKTESCRNWTELGHCRYGKKCRYAHGEEELRAVPRHIRYKTQICRAYHMDGSCPYGIRCTFVHESDKLVQNDRRNSFVSQDESISSNSSFGSNNHPYIMKQQQKQHYIETVYYNTSTQANMALWM